MMRLKLFSSLLVLLLITFLGCEEDPLSTERYFNSSGLVLTDTTITLDVIFIEGSHLPNLKLNANLGFTNEGNPAKIDQISIRLQGQYPYMLSTYYLIEKFGKSFINLSLNMDTPRPFAEYPIIYITVFYKTDSAGQEIIRSLEIAKEVRVNWNGQMEPHLQTINYSVDIDGIIWEHSSNGFYFYGNGTLSPEINYCKNKDLSLTKLPIRMEFLRLLDITSDDKYLLISDSSTIFLYNIANNTKEVLVPTHDNLWVGTAKYSYNDDLIAISMYSHRSSYNKDPIFIYSTLHKSLIKIDNYSTYSGEAVAGWLPNSTDEIYFHSSTSTFTTYSISKKTTKEYDYPDHHWRWEMLNDGNTLLSLYSTRIIKNNITEIHLFMHNLGGQLLQQLTFYPENIFEFAASPDLKYLAFSGYRNHKWGLWTIPLEK